jgi:hypothetical protein
MRLLGMTAVLAVSALLSGCGGKTMMVSEPRSAADCPTGPGARCDIAVQRGSTYRCDAGTFDVTPDLVKLRGGNPVNLKWDLPDGTGSAPTMASS